MKYYVPVFVSGTQVFLQNSFSSRQLILVDVRNTLVV
ncbi:unnamed protein product [Strongylus vulgaris]|uniref:Uncharacterized protein n=1 Tax=Strongylus vulgaris TaxID=40348 RepID=A0A3P7LMX0_STRVU|nr:unnamed protein product [Strongylus vulgaris]